MNGVLAETVQVGADFVAFVIAILVVIVVVSVTTVVLGFVLAPKAARGSQAAMGWWIVALILEGCVALSSLASLAGGFHWTKVVATPIVAAQVALYFRAKRDHG